MADLKLTPEQQQAVDTRGCSLLVTAAAGSGKTAVLVRRILEQICDREHPADITDFLVVTFTRAAAGEMREKMATALAERLAQSPGDRRLMRQLALLPHASFETIDGFYYRLVQQHSDLLPLSPAARIASETELELLQEQVLAELLEQYYAKGDEGFLQAVEYFSATRDDARFVEVVRRLRDRLSALPNAPEWLARQVALYRSPPAWQQRPYAQTLHFAAELQINYAQTLLQEACAVAEADEVLAAKYLPSLLEYGQRLQALSAAAADLDALAALLDWKFPGFKAAKGADEGAKAQVTALRDAVKDCFKRLRDLAFLSTEEADADAAALCGVVTAVAEFVQAFEQRYLEAKTARRLLDFPDLSHYAFSLLVQHYDEAGGQHVPTALAQALSKQYREILVDEYQDTNRLQDAIFSCLSNGGRNLFLVGDAKQSIYLFRQAEPRIFVDKKQTFVPAVAGEGAAQQRLSLNRNFRSTRAVVSFVNTLFGATMEPVLGGFSYAEEALQFGAPYDPAHDAPVELTLLVEGEQQEEAEAGTGFEAEAAAVAQRICALLAEGTVLDKNGTPRPIQPRDIVVLLRTVKNRAAQLEQLLAQAGVPVYADSTESFFSREEISTLLSYLQILDNPLQDVHVAAVLRSPMYGVNADELARIRLAREEEQPFYRCVQAMRDHLPKAARFLEDFEALRRVAQRGSVERLLTALLERTGYSAMVAAMPQGELRCANLRLLQRYAAEFEQTAHRGLFRFNLYLDGLRRSGRDLPAAKQVAEHSDVVRIMSIHKSKGLEFPVVVLCDLDHRFNLQDQNERLLLHNEVGIGLKLRDSARMVEFDTLQRAAVRSRLHRDSVAEELRCLYVAVTRAQQRLLLFANARGSRRSTVHKLEQVCIKDGAVHPAQLLDARSHAELLLLALQTTHQGRALCDHYGLPQPRQTIEGHCTLSLLTPERQQPCTPYRQRTAEGAQADAPIPDLAAQLSPIGTAAATLPAKLTVTRLKDAVALPGDDLPQGDRLQAYRRQQGLRRPRFVAEQGAATPAEAGTAMHELVQFAFLRRLHSDPIAEIEHLVQHGFLTARQRDLISLERVNTFTQSPLFQRMMQADALQRELKFTILCTAAELLPEPAYDAQEEELLLQGVIDCVMREPEGITLIDFKTDRVVNAQVLVDRYRNQLRLYRLAYRRMTGQEVRRCVIYSFGLGMEIEVEL